MKNVRFFISLFCLLTALANLNAMEAIDNSSDTKRSASIHITDEDIVTQHMSALTVRDNESLINPDNLFFYNIAYKLMRAARQPTKLYDCLVALAQDYPMELICFYMKVLNIDPDQEIIETTYTNAEQTEGQYHRTPLILYALKQKNKFVYSLLKHLGASNSCIGSEFIHLKAEYDEEYRPISLFKAYIHGYMKIFLAARKNHWGNPKLIFQHMISELALARLLLPDIFTKMTDEFIAQQIRKIASQDSSHYLLRLVMQDIYSVTEDIYTESSFYDEKIAIEFFSESDLSQKLQKAVKSITYRILYLVLRNNETKPTDYKQPKLSIKTRASDSETTLTHKPLFQDLCFALRNTENDVNKLYDVLCCKKYPVVIIMIYLFLNGINVHELKIGALSFLEYSIITNNLQVTFLTFRKDRVTSAMQELLEVQLINNPHFDFQAKHYQTNLINFYLDFAIKTNVLFTAILELALLRKNHPAIFGHITGDLILEQARKKDPVVQRELKQAVAVYFKE